MLTKRLPNIGDFVFSYKNDESLEYQISAYPITNNCQLVVLGSVCDLLDSVADNKAIKDILKELTINHFGRNLALVDIHNYTYDRFMEIVKDTVLSDSTYHSTSGSTMHVIVFNASNLI